MNIFELPEVFLRELMKTMEIKDRLTLLQVSRAFEKLVANTHAGHFDKGLIKKENNNLTIWIGHTNINAVWTEGTAKTLLEMRNSLFTGISFEYFEIAIDDGVASGVLPTDANLNSTLEFILQFTRNFNIEVLSVTTKCEAQFAGTLHLMQTFPGSRFKMNIYFIPELEQLSLLPAMEEILIMARDQDLTVEDVLQETHEISSEIFLELLASHKIITCYFGSVALTLEEWIKGVQILSADNRERKIDFVLHNSIILKFLSDLGIDENNGLGDVCGEFQVMGRNPEDEDHYGSILLRHEECWISINQFTWTDGDSRSVVRMTNVDMW